MISMLSMIFAHSSNGVIGKDNKIPWKCKEDMEFFKERTTGHHIIMGRKTFESFSKPLPNRTSVVLTQNKDYKSSYSNVKIVHSVEEALEVVKNDPEPYVIGGAQIYDLFLDYCFRIYRTEICKDYEGDAVISKKILERCKSQTQLIGKGSSSFMEGNKIVGINFYTHQIRIPNYSTEDILGNINKYFDTDFNCARDILKAYNFAKKARSIEERLIRLCGKSNDKLNGIDEFISLVHNTIYHVSQGNTLLLCPRDIDKPSLFNLPDGKFEFKLKDIIPELR